METNIMTGTRTQTENNMTFSRKTVWMYKTQQKYSVLKLAQFKTITTDNSAMSAAYSKNVQNVSFFVWKKSEFRDMTVLLDNAFSFSKGLLLYPYACL